MPKKEEIVESNMNSNDSESYIDPDWLALKQEYDSAKKHEEDREKNILEKEKDDFAKMWLAAGLDLKETLESKCITSAKKRN